MPEVVPNLHMLGLSRACDHTHAQSHFPFLKERAMSLMVLMETVNGRDNIAPEGFACLFSFAVLGMELRALCTFGKHPPLSHTTLFLGSCLWNHGQ